MRHQKSCRQWQVLLAISHPEDDLTPSEYAALEKHVAQCAGCQAIRAEYRAMTAYFRTQTAVRSLPSSTSQRIRLRANLEREQYVEPVEKQFQPGGKQAKPLYSFSDFMVAGLAFACAIVLLLASLHGLHLHRSVNSNMGTSPQSPTTNMGVSTTVATPGATLPPMTLPKSQYVAIAQQDAINAGISPIYFVRQINELSGFNPSKVSPTGSEGIAQFEPGTAVGLGINPWDPNQALRAAAQLMASYTRMYGGDYAKALAAYFGGTGSVNYALNNCGDAHWLNCLPGETRQYIHAIMGI